MKAEFDMADDDCGDLFNAVVRLTARHVNGPVYFTGSLRIARAVFETIIAAGQREADALEARASERSEGSG